MIQAHNLMKRRDALLAKLAENDAELDKIKNEQRGSVLAQVAAATREYKFTASEIRAAVKTLAANEKHGRVKPQKKTPAYKFGQWYGYEGRAWPGKGHLPGFLIEAMAKTGEPIEFFEINAPRKTRARRK